MLYQRIGRGRVRSADETAESRKRVRGFWHHCDDARGTPVARYLGKRGLPWLAEHPNIRFRADCPHPTGARLPAMVALIYDSQGSIAALHRTFLDLNGDKARVDPVKATLGAFSGCAFRVHEACAEMLVGEGIETSAAAAMLLDTPAWSALACGNLGWKLALPFRVRSVIIAVDNDESGRTAARAAGQRWQAEGRIVRFAIPQRPGADFNDLILRGGSH